MSRRESRNTLNLRQNDALSEFENFKKKFLLANKHITKLNAALSIRIEELTNQISALMSENVDLRTGQITLQGQVRREKDKSRKMMADAEAATSGLMKHLGLIRQSYMVTPVSVPKPPPSAKAKRPVRDSNASPHQERLARIPDYPDILEEEEPLEPQNTVATLRKKRRPSISSAAIPTRPPSPVDTYSAPAPIDERESMLPKPTSRRQSGLVTPSPVASSSNITSRRPRHRTPSATDEDDGGFKPSRASPDLDDVNMPPPIIASLQEHVDVPVIKRSRSKRSLAPTEALAEDTEQPPKRKSRLTTGENHFNILLEGNPTPLPATQFADVTNSPRRKLAAQDIKKAAEHRRNITPENPLDAPLFTIRTPANPPSSQYPTPSSSNSSPLDTATPSSQNDGAEDPNEGALGVDDGTVGGRERRTKKSVNYAEPKLNTKMRKPREEGEASSKRRASTTPRPRSQEKAPWDRVQILDDEPLDIETEVEPVPLLASPELGDIEDSDWKPTSIKRKRASASSSQTLRIAVLPEDEDTSEGAQADREFGTLNGVTARRRTSQAPRTSSSSSSSGRRHSTAV